MHLFKIKLIVMAFLIFTFQVSAKIQKSSPVNPHQGYENIYFRYDTENNKLISITSSKIDSIKIESLYGEFSITEPVAIKLIFHPMFQRLKFIHQYGLVSYLNPPAKDFSRFEHSIGVFLLLRKYNCSLNEQLAGLLHDASHTVFSHVSDYLFLDTQLTDSYQDNIHELFLLESGLAKILQLHSIATKDILHKNKNFTALEQPSGEICADRLEYNLRGGFIEGLLTQNDITAILNDIKFENNIWYFTDKLLAKKFALVPLFHTEHVWTSAKTTLVDKIGAKLLKRALKINLIDKNEIHFSTDNEIWNKLTNSKDFKIQYLISKLMNLDNEFEIVKTPLEKYDAKLSEKFRGINPWVKTDNGLQRLVELDEEFKQEYLLVQTKMQVGWRIRFKNHLNQDPVSNLI